MVSQIFAPLPSDVSLVFDFFTVLGTMIVILICVTAVCIMAASIITFIAYFICEWICWPFSERYERDIELGRVGHRARIVTYQAVEVQDNYPTSRLDILEGLPSSIEERRQLRQQALEKLLPQAVIYGSKETLSNNSGDCSICLDDYSDGEFCRVFPVCSHMFHVKCIDHWLNNHLTCPVCRKCLLDS